MFCGNIHIFFLIINLKSIKYIDKIDKIHRNIQYLNIEIYVSINIHIYEHKSYILLSYLKFHMREILCDIWDIEL